MFGFDFRHGQDCDLAKKLGILTRTCPHASRRRLVSIFDLFRESNCAKCSAILQTIEDYSCFGELQLHKEDNAFGRKLMLESCCSSSTVNFHSWVWAARSTNIRCKTSAWTISVSSKSFMFRNMGTWKRVYLGIPPVCRNFLDASYCDLEFCHHFGGFTCRGKGKSSLS